MQRWGKSVNCAVKLHGKRGTSTNFTAFKFHWQYYDTSLTLSISWRNVRNLQYHRLLIPKFLRDHSHRQQEVSIKQELILSKPILIIYRLRLGCVSATKSQPNSNFNPILKQSYQTYELPLQVHWSDNQLALQCYPASWVQGILDICRTFQRRSTEIALVISAKLKI